MKTLRLMALLLPMMMHAHSSASDSEEEDVISGGKKRTLVAPSSPMSTLSSEDLLETLKKRKLPNFGRTSDEKKKIRECVKDLRRLLSLAPIDRATQEQGQQLANALSNGTGTEKQVKDLKNFIEKLSLNDE